MALVTVTFDISDATAEDYAAITQGLAVYGLNTTLPADDGTTARLPRNVYAGRWTEQGYSNNAHIRSAVDNLVSTILRSRGRRGRYFITVGSKWAWQTGTV